MKRDFKSCMLYALFGLPIFLLLFIASIYFVNCGFSASCSQASLPPIIHTPIPTLVPVNVPYQVAPVQVETRPVCLVTGRDLLNSWVSAGYQETQPFYFSDLDGNSCQAMFADVITLFDQQNLWYSGALACDSCHNADVTVAAAGLDLSSYPGILAGARRTSSTSQGEDILGGGDWEESVLHDQLFVYQLMPFGAPPGALLPDGPTLQAGILATIPIETPAETPRARRSRPTWEPRGTR